MATQRFYDGQPGPDIRRELNNFEAILDGTVAAAQDASTAATSASVKAQQWADAAPGVEVETGKYSAKHWADRAQTTVTGGLIYRGSHSAASGAYPATPSLGDYYKISVAGTLGGVAYSVGDSIIYNGTGWDKIDSTDAVTSVSGRVGAVVLTKSDVGLSNVDNTSDVDKPVSTAAQTALDGKANTTHTHAIADVTGLQSTLDTLTSHTGNTSNPHGVTKVQVGLGDVDNTSDANKPISSATQAALNTKEGAIASGTTTQYWRGDKTWRDFFTDVRAATLTGLSTATNAVVAATDTVLAAIGKLQAQVSTKFDKTGGDVNGNINFTGTGRRITGDFSNGTIASRVSFQTSTTNGNTVVQALPNGTSQQAQFSAYNQQDPTHSGIAQMLATGSEVSFRAATAGAGFPASTYLPMTFYTGGAERMRIDTSGNVLVNLSAPRVFNNGVAAPVFQVGNTGVGASIGITRFTSKADAPARIILARSGSDTLGTDAVVPSNTNLGTVDFQGYDGSAYIVRASIRGHVEGAVGSANIPTAIVLSTGATTLQDRLRIDSSGNVLVTSPAGLGYGIGAGGTVTQSTSKSTAVTLNKPTGQITMNNATLAAGATIAFQLNNTLITTVDSLILTIDAYSITDIPTEKYSVSGSVTGSAAYITVKNISAGSLSEALRINFTIVKGATT